MKGWVLAASLTVACARAPSGAHAWLVVDGAAGSDVDLAAAHVEGPGVREVVLAGSRLVVDVDPLATRGLVVRAGGACPLVVPKAALQEGKTRGEKLEPLFDVGPGPSQIGFDEKFEITARPRCKEAESLKLSWKPGTGAPLRDVAVSNDGRRFEARTARFDEVLGHAVPWGVVPISPRTRGATEIEVSWVDKRGSRTKRTVHVSAAARARGLPNVALGTRLYLGGQGMHVVAAPTGAKASIEDGGGGHATLTPDARGKWTLADSEGRLLRLVAGKYDETPLDCGRSDCHAAVSDVERTSPMATIFERGLDAKFAGNYPACALGCHTVGEPGVDDGGFTAVLSELGRTPSDLGRTGFHDLPPALRRLSGVGCLGCHGPGAIPEESARHSILSADVCAVCHDAPPRYGHVAAWRTSRMAVADANAKAASDPECVRCHTTWGFLGRPERRPHEGTAPLGIGCAACHSVHPSSPEQAVSAGTTCADTLLRNVPVPPLLGDATEARATRSKICLGCHTPGPRDAVPTGTAGALWLGRGGVDPATGKPLESVAPHAAVPNGCVGCHRTGPTEVERGGGHAFRAGTVGCAACHAPKAPEAAIRSRAEALWKSFTADAANPPHASRPLLDLSTPRGRAAWDVALVLEDPAAETHNAPYARRLLDAAEAVVEPRPGAPR